MVTLRSVAMLPCSFWPPLFKNSGSAPGGPIQQKRLIVENVFGFDMKYSGVTHLHKTGHMSKLKTTEKYIYQKMSDNVLFILPKQHFFGQDSLIIFF